ncbi:hypothetical protein NE579_16265, partial [Intestinimonas massiliensis]|nr:hypothetical protein [Intestinimonas massiliensis (ex Afouda et al. 2020)]
GLEAEERGQGEAIARTLARMSALTVPVVSVITGEGGPESTRRRGASCFPCLWMRSRDWRWWSPRTGFCKS